MAFRGPYTKLFCHIVWATWDRLPLIDAEVEPRLHGMIQNKLRELDCVSIATGGVEDHVHVVCQFPPTLAISELVKRIKGASSHFVSDELAGRETFRWQGTYGCFTIGESALPKVKAYVLNQRQHHASDDTHREWERVWIDDPVESNDQSPQGDFTMMSGDFQSPDKRNA